MIRIRNLASVLFGHLSSVFYEYLYLQGAFTFVSTKLQIAINTSFTLSRSLIDLNLYRGRTHFTRGPFISSFITRILMKLRWSNISVVLA